MKKVVYSVYRIGKANSKMSGIGYITTQPTESFGTFLRNICKCSLPNSLGKSKTAPPFQKIPPASKKKSRYRGVVFTL